MLFAELRVTIAFRGLPVPSYELNRVIWAKAWISCFLNEKAQR
ncbi:hypothetical protein F3Y22_tig00112255pilonHSYRG00080 [Hibiscus syriacus]|uniref:Uncharacterized protein n=1 Tax=Hibiscus syriacus TaxID=106335 RepID=A0A6A2XH56_HIBSY|nr:hypothetical protein F3Y22_tig00112255pilonHSYRG00080 [Hibiscus syriacus]